jgi:hypothetical protein
LRGREGGEGWPEMVFMVVVNAKPARGGEVVSDEDVCVVVGTTREIRRNG